MNRQIYDAFINLLHWSRRHDLGDFKVRIEFTTPMQADRARCAFLQDCDWRDLSLTEQRPGLTGMVCNIPFEIGYKTPAPRAERTMEEFKRV